MYDDNKLKNIWKILIFLYDTVVYGKVQTYKLSSIQPAL